MRCLRFIPVVLTFFFALNISAGNKPALGGISTSKNDTLNYLLSISEAQVPALKDTIFNREECLITRCPLTLTNISRDTLKYQVMSASWWESYKLDNQNFAFAADWWNVLKNGPEVLMLPPHQSTTKNIRILTYKAYNRGQRIRIGMILKRSDFDLPDLKTGFIPLMPKKTVSLIWSNEVVIN